MTFLYVWNSQSAYHTYQTFLQLIVIILIETYVSFFCIIIIIISFNRHK